jgi:hypothetical protein
LNDLSGVNTVTLTHKEPSRQCPNFALRAAMMELLWNRK